MQDQAGEAFMRRAALGDVAALTALLNEAMQYKIRRGDFAWGTRGFGEQHVRDRILRGEMYLLSQGGAAVGTACLQWDDEVYWGKQPKIAGYLHGLAVSQGLHGRGMGARILDWALQAVAGRGRALLRLDCEASNAGLCRYYERHGFIRAGDKRLNAACTVALYQRAVGDGDLKA